MEEGKTLERVLGFSQSVVVREKHNIAGSWQLVSEC